MNKENSMENEMSTEIGDTLKSYSSKYRQLKQIRTLKTTPHLLPVKLEKAVLTIQRFWRRTMILRKRLYNSLHSELDSQISLLHFENQALVNITSIYEADCKARTKMIKAQAQQEVKTNQTQCSSTIRKLVVLTLQMEKKKVSLEDLEGLQKEKNYWKSKVEDLRSQKEELQGLISQQLQEEEAQFMRHLKEQKLALLQVTKRRGDLQKQLRERLVEACRQEIAS